MVNAPPRSVLGPRPALAPRRGLRSPRSAAIGLTAPELEAIRRRGAYVRDCWVQGGEGDWMIEHIATDPAYRGRGLVQALIEAALAKGRAAGFRRATISFLIGNEPAERAYTKAGFALADEKRDPAFEALIGAPGFRMFARMI